MTFSFDCQKIRSTVVRRKCLGKRTRLRGCTFNTWTSSFSGDKNCSLVIFKCTSTLQQEFKGGKFSANAVKTKEVPRVQQRQVCMNMI